MAKFNNVDRFEVKSEYVDDFHKVFSDLLSCKGLLSQILIKTGEKNYCGVRLWESEGAVIKTSIKGDTPSAVTGLR